MSILDRKLLRDLAAAWTQAAMIGLLVALGVAVLVGSAGTYASLARAQAEYYAATRFADVFADLRRAPPALLERIAELDGVAAVEGRIAGAARIEWPQADLPVSALLLSLPGHGEEPLLDHVTLREGRLPERDAEAVLHRGFAAARNLRPGDSLPAVVNGRRVVFRITGIGDSPDQIHPLQPGAILPDDAQFAVLWVPRPTLAAALDMEGAFNRVSLSLAPGAREAAVIAALDRLLLPHGGRGAHGRDDHPSHRRLTDEIEEQRVTAIFVPALFLGVAAFLLHTALGRMIEAARVQVATLKALGLPPGPIAWHYAKFAGVIAVAGAAFGIAGGHWLGGVMIELYRPFFHLPGLVFAAPAWLAPLAVLLSLAAALAAVARALLRLLREPAAQGLRPQPPERGAGARLTLGGLLPPEGRLALRGLAARPVRSLLTVFGLAAAMPVTVLGLFWWDAVGWVTRVQFDGVERGHVVVTFTDPRGDGVLHDLARLPGVLAAEGQRVVAVRLSHGHRSRRVGLSGLPEGGVLRTPRDATLAPVPIPREGLAVSRRLAEALGATAGTLLRVEVLEGARPVLHLPIAALVEDAIGLSAQIERAALNRALGEGPLINQASLRVDRNAEPALFEALAERPRIAAIASSRAWTRIFDEQMAGLVLASAAILLGFGAAIAVGIVAGSARVAFQERAQELAALRVLGFRVGEAWRLLAAEFAVLLAFALPLGAVLSGWTVAALLSIQDNETISLPPIVSVRTLAAASLLMVAAAAAAFLLLRRRIARLDLVVSLKVQE